MRLAWVLAGVVGLNVLAWSTFASGAGRSSAAVVSAGFTAFVLGARHAFDADHIAVIDDCTRLAVQQGHRRVGMGFTFAMGHSSVVMVLTALVILVAGSPVQSWTTRWQEVGSPVVAAVAGMFLVCVGLLNARVLVALFQERARQPTAGVDTVLARGRVLSRLWGTGTRAVVGSSWRLFPVGFLFGLGLETASEVCLLAVTATSAMSGGACLASLLALPLLFAAGMVLFDTANSLLVSRLYWTTGHADARRLRFNVAMTAVTAVAGIGIGVVYLAGVLSKVGPLQGLSGVAVLSTHYEALGMWMVGAYALVWIVTLVPSGRAAR